MTKISRYKLIDALLVCAIVLTALAYHGQNPVNHDTGWFMYAARGMLAGGQLFKDYIDVNAPMAYYTVMPAAALSNIPGISNDFALALNVIGFVVIGQLLTMAITRRMNLPWPQMIFLNAGILFIQCFMPHSAFGQREHLMVALVMPYSLAAAFRTDNKALPPWLAIACGIAAGIGVSIKLPYAAVPMLIELGVLIRHKTWKIGFTYDVLALAVSFIIINGLCFAMYPEYWTEILPEAMALYGPYDNFRFLSDALMVQIPMFAVGFVAGEYRGRGPLIAARWMMSASTLGVFALFIVQRKGWPHHGLPIEMYIGAMCILNMLDVKFKKAKNNGAARFRAAISLAVLLSAFWLSYWGGNVDPSMIEGVENYVKQTDGSFYIISTGNYPAFPLALNRNYHWTSRYPQLIMMPGLIEANVKGQISPYETAFRATVADDLRNGHPATVFWYVPTDAGMWDGVNDLAWLRHDPDFESEWKHYHQIGATGPFAVYVRNK